VVCVALVMETTSSIDKSYLERILLTCDVGELIYLLFQTYHRLFKLLSFRLLPISVPLLGGFVESLLPLRLDAPPTKHLRAHNVICGSV
jgi:hypothetical protein